MMGQPPSDLSTDELWRRVGLEELRQSLRGMETAIQDFERMLQRLPSCNTCARSILLEHLGHTSQRLGREAVNLSVLADSLKQAMVIVEKEEGILSMNPPEPCRCTDTPCRCHEN